MAKYTRTQCFEIRSIDLKTCLGETRWNTEQNLIRFSIGRDVLRCFHQRFFADKTFLLMVVLMNIADQLCIDSCQRSSVGDAVRGGNFRSMKLSSVEDDISTSRWFTWKSTTATHRVLRHQIRRRRWWTPLSNKRSHSVFDGIVWNTDIEFLIQFSTKELSAGTMLRIDTAKEFTGEESAGHCMISMTCARWPMGFLIS